jgi:Glycosyl transferase 4-like domain
MPAAMSRKQTPEGPDGSPPAGRWKTVRFLVRGYARRLPGDRGDAALAMFHDARGLVTGRQPTATRPGDPPVDPATLLRAERALARGDLDTAWSQSSAILEDRPDSMAGLTIRRIVLERRGEPTSVLATIRTMRSVLDTPELARDERVAVGRLFETDPRWSPRIPGPERPIESPDPGVVMHLVAGPLADPAGSTGSPAADRIVAERAAGLDPLAVGPVEAGSSGRAGGGQVGPAQTVDGAAVHRLELGPAWSPDGPPDLALIETAWLAARVGRDARPAVVVAAPGVRGFDTMLVGVALRGHLGIPLVIDASIVDRSAPPGSEQAIRARATEDRCLAVADAVIAPDEETRRDLIGRGVAADRIAVVDDSASREDVGAARRAVYATVTGRRPQGEAERTR